MKKYRNKQKQILFILLFCFSGFNSFSQSLDRKISGYGKFMDYQFKIPDHFLELDSGTFMRTNACIFKTETGEVRSILLSAPFSYSIISEKKDIVVTFMIDDGTMFDSLCYEQYLRAYSDVIHPHIVRYSGKYLSKTSHATAGSLYIPDCPFYILRTT